MGRKKLDSDVQEVTILSPDQWTDDQWQQILDIAVHIDESGIYADEKSEPMAKLKAVVSAVFVWLEDLEQLQAGEGDTLH